jgi:hypothetical protein
MRFVIFLFLTSSAFGQNNSSQIEQLEQEILAHQSQIVLIQSRIDSIKVSALSASSEMVEHPRVKLGISVRLYAEQNASRHFIRKSTTVNGIINDAQGERIHFVGDDGVQGWMGTNDWELEQDGTEFLKLIELKTSVAPSTRSLVRNANQRFYDRAILAESRKQKKAVEQERIDKKKAVEQERIDRLIAAGIVFELSRFSWQHNSAGGVEPFISIQNFSNKTIKYTSIQGRVFNRVGDPAPAKHGDRTNLLSLKLVGPVSGKSAESYSYKNNPPFYNDVAHCIEVRKIIVEFTDGSMYTMVKDLQTMRKDQSDFKIQGECELK